MRPFLKCSARGALFTLLLVTQSAFASETHAAGNATVEVTPWVFLFVWLVQTMIIFTSLSMLKQTLTQEDGVTPGIKMKREILMDRAVVQSNPGKPKDDLAGKASFSRLAGAVGTIVLASLFAGLSLIHI